MAQQSPSLASIVALEGGERTQGTPYHSYYALAHGQLDTAVTEAAADADVQARIVRLAAASHGASAALLQQARVLPESAGLDPITAPSAWALAAREGWQTDALRAATLQGTGEDGAYIARFFDAVQAGGSQQQAEAALGGVSLVGAAWPTMAAVLLGQRCPDAWRRGAQQLLFASERPYLG